MYHKVIAVPSKLYVHTYIYVCAKVMRHTCIMVFSCNFLNVHECMVVCSYINLSNFLLSISKLYLLAMLTVLKVIANFRIFATAVQQIAMYYVASCTIPQ